MFSACRTKKRQAYVETLKSILRDRACAPSLAASLAGRLNFATTYLWGRAPRVYMKPFYRHSEGESHAVSASLSSAVGWWVKFLEVRVSRFYETPSSQTDFLVHTDASLTGLGVSVRRRGGHHELYAARVPDGFCDLIPSSSNLIFTLELLGALLGAQVLTGYASRRDKLANAIFFVDNNPALCSLLRGSTECELATNIILNFWATLASSRTTVWLERIRSCRNEGDAPSRGAGPALEIPFPSVFG